jgi:hypothetical protein
MIIDKEKRKVRKTRKKRLTRRGGKNDMKQEKGKINRMRKEDK